MERKPEYKQALEAFRNEILTSVESEKVNAWDLKDLGFQASQRICKSTDPLRLLQDLSQNFPMYANSLARIRVNKTIQAEIANNHKIVDHGKNALQVNRISLNLEQVKCLFFNFSPETNS